MGFNSDVCGVSGALLGKINAALKLFPLCGATSTVMVQLVTFLL